MSGKQGGPRGVLRDSATLNRAQLHFGCRRDMMVFFKLMTFFPHRPCVSPLRPFRAVGGELLNSRKSRKVSSRSASEASLSHTMLCRLVVLLALSGADALQLGAAASRRSFLTKVKLPKEFWLHRIASGFARVDT